MRSRPSRYRYPTMIIGQAVWQYHRFNQSYRDVREQLLYRGIDVSYEAIRERCYKFASCFEDIIKKKQRKPKDKCHLDEMTVKLNGEYFILWRAIDSEGYELDVFLQKRRNKKSAIRFLSRLLQSYPVPRVIVTDKLKSYIKPIKAMCRHQNIVVTKGWIICRKCTSTNTKERKMSDKIQVTMGDTANSIINGKSKEYIRSWCREVY